MSNKKSTKKFDKKYLFEYNLLGRILIFINGVHMTFRPTNEVLDEIAAGQSPSFSGEQYKTPNQNDGEHIFNRQEDQGDSQDSGGENMDSFIFNIPTEEVKAPDLSELLKNSGNENIENNADPNIDNTGINQNSQQPTPEINSIENTSNIIQTTENMKESVHIEPQTQETPSDLNMTQLGGDKELQNNNTSENLQVNKEFQSNNTSEILQANKEQTNYIDDNKLPDEERVNLVSSIEGSINSNLDYLVDKKWYSIVKKYKIINRLFFRWGIFLFAVIVGILCGVMFQVKAGNTSKNQIINDSSIENKSGRIEETSDKKLSTLTEEGLDIEIIVPYGLASSDGNTFQTKGNLIKFKGIILPQLVSLDKTQEIISLDDFNAKKTTREDIEKMIKLLITNDSIYRNTTNFPNVGMRTGKIFDGTLIDGFNLGCLDNGKLSDFVCDRFLENFNTYGKYFDLSQYAGELLVLIKDIKKQKKNIEPICNMVKEYTLHAGAVSETLLSVMEYCGDDYNSYKKMVNFIDLEKSLGQPEIPEKVYDDPDLNAYKLLSAQQSVHKILDGTSLNENYIKSYLKYVQTLIDKDKGKNNYLPAIYKDMLYVFNSDELTPKLIQKPNFSSDLKTQLDQINNGNSIYGYSSLISQLTTPDIIKTGGNNTGEIVIEKTIEEIFAPYYTMTDHLKIRDANPISEDKIKVQTEISSNKIMSVTNGKTLKVTVVLYKKDNVLYVDTIKVAGQTKLSDILSIYASEGDITFYAMLNYIDEQVVMRYELEPKHLEEEPSVCESLEGINDISIYTCDNLSISLYKGDIEYNFTLENGVLNSFMINDEKLDIAIREKLSGVMFTKYNTPTIIMSIIDFSIEQEEDKDTIAKKLEIVDQFRIHFKLIPDDVQTIEGKSDEFLVDFTLGEFKLQAHYDLNTHLLTKISYKNCEKPLEIRQLTIELTAENEPQLMEIINNPKVFFVNANQTVYKKYQKTCLGIK